MTIKNITYSSEISELARLSRGLSCKRPYMAVREIRLSSKGQKNRPLGE